jgi:predicted TIM-barrel fold metal-dependent hydrolase
VTQFDFENHHSETTPATNLARNPRTAGGLAHWLSLGAIEKVIDPHRAIIDAHHHLWPDHEARYGYDDLLSDLNAGHLIEKTVFVECNANLRPDSPDEEKSLGETEFACAAKRAARQSDRPGICEAIVGYVDLRTGSRAGDLLDRHFEVSGGHLRGIRNRAHREPSVDYAGKQLPEGLLIDPRFREGFAGLAKRGLSYDALQYFMQLPELYDLAAAFPDTLIIINHCGSVLGTGTFESRRGEWRSTWLHRLSKLAALPNTVMKLGGLGMVGTGFSYLREARPPTSQTLAKEWIPYMRPLIDMFGPERCMFESNFPPDNQSCTYRTLWNALKRVAEPYSESEKDWLFRRCAAQAYRI